MKLYYDNLVPFMPDSIVVNEERVPNVKLAAARKAMIMLSTFQRNHNVDALYESVYQISVYEGIDIVDLILSLGDINVGSGTIDELLDIAAKNLFKVISPNFEPDSFDYKSYSATLLSIAHTVFTIQTQLEQNAGDNTTPAEEHKMEQEEQPNS